MARGQRGGERDGGGFGGSRGRGGRGRGGGYGGGRGFGGDDRPPKVESENQIFVQGMPTDVSEDEVASFFRPFGTLQTDRKTGKPRIFLYTERNKGEATVAFNDPSAAQSAVPFFDGREFSPGRPLKVGMHMINAPPSGGFGGPRGGGGRGRGRGGYGRGGGSMDRDGPGPPHRETERLTRELYEEQNLNDNQLGEIEQLSLTVDRLRDELTEAREELQQERNRADCAVEKENYWEKIVRQKQETIETKVAELKKLETAVQEEVSKVKSTLAERLHEAQNNLMASEEKNKVLEVKVDQLKVDNSTLLEEKGKTQQHLDQIEGRNQVLTADLERSKNQNTEDNKRHLKLLEAKTERIKILEKSAEKLEDEKVACRREENERVKALEKETKSVKSEKEELKKKLSEKTKEEKQMKSKQRMHFAMVDAFISNMIKEKETPQSTICSLNLLKRCSQQFIDEDTEKEEPSKKKMKKEYSEKPRKQRLKQEIKEEYFEQSGDVRIKNEEDKEAEAEEEAQSTSPAIEPILDTNRTLESDPSPRVEAHDSENGTSNQPAASGNNSE